MIRMWDQLPVELVRAVLLAAARAAVNDRRRWATQLALVSRDIYQLVHPVIYYRMVVTEENMAAVQSLLDDDSCAHVFAAVRHLVYPFFIDDGPAADFARPFTGLESVDAPKHLLRYLACRPDFAPYRLGILHADLDRARQLPQSSLVNVTHIRGFVLRLFSGTYREGPQSWVDELLCYLPALTHLALDLSAGDHSSSLFKPLIEAALHHIRLQRLICCCARDRQATVLHALSSVHDERVYLWCDARSNSDFVMELVADAKAGRNVWEDGQPIWVSDAGAAAA